jgi:hypothetical protein
MEIGSSLGYWNQMRYALITLLICLFAGVTSAAAFTTPKSLHALERSIAQNADNTGENALLSAFQAHWCKADNKTGTATKPFGCGPDYISHFGATSLDLPLADGQPESTPPPVLMDGLPFLHDQPPIEG